MQRILALVILVGLLGVFAFLFLKPRGNPNLDPAQGARLALGRPDAPVTVVDFSNYLCPHCRDHSEKVLPRLMAEYVETGKVRYVFRDFPFPGQANVVRAGEAAACAADQNRYLDYHQALFRDPSWGNLSGEALDRYLTGLAGQLGLDERAFGDCLASGKHRDEVLADQKLANDLGLTGTPSFFIAGERYTGYMDYARWKELLDKALGQ
ncbi:DsbA family protein [Thermus filiformis]|uniref:Thiol:disulfide interchange protein n=1 Tax=Thermus filiformis TaxID=276 RepID=A0A0A2X835_THEFI|nr:DsbA family protein [Thermus filiformis]KGQ21404.1 thiol:disulfide interchange protein [Thermus filiformis]